MQAARDMLALQRHAQLPHKVACIRGPRRKHHVADRGAVLPFAKVQRLGVEQEGAVGSVELRDQFLHVRVVGCQNRVRGEWDRGRRVGLGWKLRQSEKCVQVKGKQTICTIHRRGCSCSVCLWFKVRCSRGFSMIVHEQSDVQ
eukprot:2719416-Rhodomonas_salina.9